MSLRIVHVVCTAAFAGVERHIAMLARQQLLEGDTVTVVGGNPADMRHHLQDSVEVLPAQGPVAAARQLRRLGGVDIINAHMTEAEVAAALVQRGARAIVATRHFGRRRGSHVLGRAVGRRAANRIAGQIAVSQFVAERIEGMSRIVYSGTPSRPDPAPAEVRERSVLVLQRLEPEKETEIAVSAFAAAGLAAQGWRLRIGGDGAQAAALRRQVDAQGLSGHVDFLGHVRDVSSEMDRGGMLLAPRSSEDFGLTVIEAMAAGLPVVAADGGGHLETVGLVASAALFPPRDPIAAGALLRELAVDERRRDLYAKDLQAVQRGHFTVKRQSAATRRVYEDLL